VLWISYRQPFAGHHVRRFAAATDGVAAVEAAFLFPILIGLIMAALQFSMVFYTNSAMQTAARDVTRLLAVNVVKIANADSEIRSRLPSWASSAATITKSESNPGSPDQNVFTVQITLPASQGSPVPLFGGWLDGWNLSSKVVMKQEDSL
jgi:Flp pilus assembly protein TadG